ncbi:hypothetical protein Pmani_039751 [Petrolisthes manimaculis]|uniref:Uncharacterized protein n=1 Tax=Petrolisthes manimaculis TaxID=1843537 RepID=A0AAE1NDC5_9EUCA|nr:hypothetical protein Pmani_039751 [Petrolisthes manimaculis]
MEELTEIGWRRMERCGEKGLKGWLYIITRIPSLHSPQSPDLEVDGPSNLLDCYMNYSHEGICYTDLGKKRMSLRTYPRTKL